MTRPNVSLHVSSVVNASSSAIPDGQSAPVAPGWAILGTQPLERLLISSGYEETRKKSGPKQGYVKKLEQKSQTLEQRLAQLEKLLATHQGQQSSSPSVSNH